MASIPLAHRGQPTRRVTLRPESADDRAFLQELYASTRDDLAVLDGDQCDTVIGLQFAARERHFADAHPDADAHIILFDARPVGRLLVDRAGASVELVDIAILPPHRNSGIGRSLVGALADDAARTGKCLRLRVLRDSPAVRLYERLGFSRAAGDNVYLEMRRDGPTCTP